MSSPRRGVEPVGTWFRRRHAESMESSDSLWSMLGIERAASSGLTWEQFLHCFHPDDRSRLAELGAEETARSGAEATFRLAGEAGSRSVRIQTRTVRDAEGRDGGVVGFAVEVSGEDGWDHDREAAHELRNQLMIVLGNLDLLQMSSPGGTSLARYVDLALDSAAKCVELTERMLEQVRARGSRGL